MAEFVSIIIPVYNRKVLLRDCLNSISNLTFREYEIIVVDDASEDGTGDFMAAEFKNIMFIRNETRKGPAYCKNQGISRSRGQFIWFLDSDSLIVDNNCLGNMIDILKNNGKIGCVGGELLKDGDVYFTRVDVDNNSRKLKFDESMQNNFHLLPVRSLSTCNLFTRKELLLQIGGFDTNYFYISEDTDICEGIRALGYIILLDERTLVLHQYSRIARKSNFYLLFRNETRCAIKNHGIVSGLLKEPVRLLRNILFGAKEKISRSKNVHSSIYIEPNDKSERNIFTLFGLGFNILTSIIKAYLWNILFLYKTIYIDKKVNYLKKQS